MNNANFTSNSLSSLESTGGAIYAVSHDSSMLIENSQINSNNAKYGGFLYGNSSSINLKSLKLNLNFADSGGALFINTT